MGGDIEKADAFILTFKPYRNRYTRQHATLFGEGWITESEYLSKGLIAQAILEQLVLGYFASHVPDILGVDLDDHQGRAWSGVEASPMLLSMYDQAVRRLRVRPSVLVQSPRGLHCYWRFSQRLPAAVLYELARRRLQGVPCEIKPTPTTALRIPAERRLLDPETLQLLNAPVEKLYPAIQVYHPAILFDEEALPETVRESLQAKRQRLRVFKNVPRIESVEAEEVPLRNGATNEAFLRLCLVYRCAGLDVEEALYRFALVLEQSPGYTGDLRNQRRLRQRVESEYRSNQWERIEAPPEVQPGLWDAAIVDNVAKHHPFSRQRTGPVRRFVSKLIAWCAWHDQVLESPGQVAYFDFLYPYYRKNRREGLYPLPRSVLHKWNDRWYQLLPWLCEIGLLERSWYQYSADLHICRYYQVHRERFS